MTQVQQSVILKDSKDIQHIVLQIDLKKGQTMVVSNFSAWENLALLMEGLAVTAEKCISDGIEKKVVYQEITDYLTKVLPAYTIKQSH